MFFRSHRRKFCLSRLNGCRFPITRAPYTYFFATADGRFVGECAFVGECGGMYAQHGSGAILETIILCIGPSMSCHVEDKSFGSALPAALKELPKPTGEACPYPSSSLPKGGLCRLVGGCFVSLILKRSPNSAALLCGFVSSA